jgi:hypothetical protein
MNKLEVYNKTQILWSDSVNPSVSDRSENKFKGKSKKSY